MQVTNIVIAVTEGQVSTIRGWDRNNKAKIRWEGNSVQEDHRRAAGWDKVRILHKKGQKAFWTQTTATECRTSNSFTHK